MEHAKPMEFKDARKAIETENKKRTRRGYGKKNDRKNKKGIQNIKFSLLGTNSNGILGKQESLKSLLNEFKPTALTIQETKLGKMGVLKLKGYQVFEKTRPNGSGGGLLTAVDEDLQPVLVSTGDEDDTELITVQIKVGERQVRIINAYGPQEDEKQQKILSFWAEIEKEVIKSKENNCLTIIQMDANAKVGKVIIKGDPHDATNNGKILLEITERQNMTIVNSLTECKGVITRERTAGGKVENL